MPQRPTLTQVADAAGVSVASASRALSGASASPDMVARVRAAAAALGYMADAMARSLKVGRTEQLALAVADLGNPVYVEMMRAIESVVRAAGYRLVLLSTGADADAEIDAIRGLNRGYADGLIISPLRITDAVVAELTQARVPVVVVGTLPRGTDLDNVRANSRRGVGLAVTHLVGSGRRAIGFVNGPVDTTPGTARWRGYLRAMRAHGEQVGAERHVAAADFTHEAGEKATQTLLARYRPDAVICANDLLAVGALRALRTSGYSVPADVAVVGMDDSELAEMATPSLTSVGLGSRERGELAAGLMLDRLRDPGRRASRLTVQPRLVVRDSSGPATAGTPSTTRARSRAASARRRSGR